VSRGRLGAYLRYQLGDYFLHRAAIPLVLVLFVAGLPLWGTLRGHPDFFSNPRAHEFAMQLYTGAVALFLPVGAFLGGVGIISADRHQGHFRFLFSKPIGVLRYYVQAYAVHGLTFVVLFGAITWTFGHLTVHVSVHRAMEAAALTFVLVGGLGFLVGTLTRLDGGLVVLAYVVAMALQPIVSESAGEVPAWVRLLAQVMPPAQALDHVRQRLYASETVDPAEMWRVLGYGGGAFLLGLFTLRKLPLAR